jgi:hypothetical protein
MSQLVAIEAQNDNNFSLRACESDATLEMYSRRSQSTGDPQAKTLKATMHVKYVVA